MKRLLLHAIGAAVLFSSLLRAQESAAAAALPPGPLITMAMPDFCQWTVEYTYTDKVKPGEASSLAKYQQEAQTDPKVAQLLTDPGRVYDLQNPRPLQVTVTKTGQVRHEVWTLEYDYKKELWAVGDYVVERRPDSPVLLAENMAGLTSTPFPEFSWISPGNFVGMSNQDGHSCLAFREQRNNEDHTAAGMAFAYVDLATRRPVMFQYKTETCRYTFLPPPTAALTMPDEFAAASKAAQLQLQRATPHLAPP